MHSGNARKVGGFIEKSKLLIFSCDIVGMQFIFWLLQGAVNGNAGSPGKPVPPPREPLPRPPPVVAPARTINNNTTAELSKEPTKQQLASIKKYEVSYQYLILYYIGILLLKCIRMWQAFDCSLTHGLKSCHILFLATCLYPYFLC